MIIFCSFKTCLDADSTNIWTENSLLKRFPNPSIYVDDFNSYTVIETDCGWADNVVRSLIVFFLQILAKKEKERKKKSCNVIFL